MAYNPLAISEILDGSPIDDTLLVKIQSNFASQKIDLDAKNSELSIINNKLAGQTLGQEITLWSGNLSLDGSSNYSLWSSAQHRAWTYVRIYVAYDSQAIGGTGGHCFEINCGSNYLYNQDTHAYTTLCTSNNGIFRRISVSTVGLNVVDGAGAGWFLTKVVGVVKKQF